VNKGRTRTRKRPIEAISGFDPLQRPENPHCTHPIERVFKKDLPKKERQTVDCAKDLAYSYENCSKSKPGGLHSIKAAIR
jgi:hypothetical protein